MNRQWGYIPNLHLTLDGDSARAGQYVPFGHNLVRQLIGSGLFAASKRLVLNDGTLIEARIAGDQRWLRINSPGGCSLWLESGFADIFPYSGDYRNDPGRIFFGGIDMAMRLYGAMDARSGTADKTPRPPSGSDSKKSFFFKERDPETMKWPESTGLHAKKVLTGQVPASLFSGKLRLFVQARYGGALMRASDNKPLLDGWAPKFLPGSPPMIEVTGAAVISTSSGLYTADDGTYWLITMDSTVLIHRVALTDCGRAVMEKLAELEADAPLPRAKRAEYEAYALSDATIDKKMTFTLQNVATVSPLAYGWKWNWNGSKASVISVDPKGAGDNTWWSTSRHDVAFNRNSKKDVSNIEDPILAERARWSMSSSASPTGEFSIQWGHAAVWAPLWSEMQQFRVSGNNQFIVAKPGSGPIYGWYDNNDNFVTVDHTLVAATGLEVHDTDPRGWSPCGAYPGMNYSREYSERNVGHTVTWTLPNGVVSANTSFSENYTDGTDVADGGEYNGPTQWLVDNSLDPAGVFSDGFQNGRSQGTTAPTGCGLEIQPILNESNAAYDTAEAQYFHDQTVSGIDYEFLGGYYQKRNRVQKSESGSRQQGGMLALVIPFLDCEAAYVFEHKRKITTPTGRQANYGYVKASIHVYRYTETVGPNTGLRVAKAVGKYLTLSPTNINLVPGPTDPIVSTQEDTTLGWYSAKAGAGEAKTDNLNAIMNYDRLTDTSAKVCFTFGSAVLGQITGSDIVEPTSEEYDWTQGGFVGWF